MMHSTFYASATSRADTTLTGYALCYLRCSDGQRKTKSSLTVNLISVDIEMQKTIAREKIINIAMV